jgi:predicted DNA-binding transcriptional regulator YafY
MKTSQVNRVLATLKQLSLGKKVCTKTLALTFEEHERNIQRDIKILKEFLGSSLLPCERGCYQLLSSNHFVQLIKQDKSSKDLQNFFEFMTLVDTELLERLQGKEFSFINQIKKDATTIYSIQENPMENLQNTKFFEQIKEAVIRRRYCDILYHETETKELLDVQPHKILYANNNWYIAAMTKNYKMNGGFKLFRINYIKKFTLKSKTFHTDIQVQRFITSMQSLFENYNTPQYEVIIHANKEVARYFKVKKYLSSQKIVQEIDGALTLSFMINNDMELIPLIRRWIPHLKVLSPASLQNKIKQDIKTYLNDL